MGCREGHTVIVIVIDIDIGGLSTHGTVSLAVPLTRHCLCRSRLVDQDAQLHSTILSSTDTIGPSLYLQLPVLSAGDDVTAARCEGDRDPVPCAACPEAGVQTGGPDLHTVAAAGSGLQAVRRQADSSHIRSEGREGEEGQKACVCVWSGGECRA